mgnify:CR=1 FL=1
MNFIVSVDLGQKQDYSAIVVVEKPLWRYNEWQYLSQHTPAEARQLMMPPFGLVLGPSRTAPDDWPLAVLHVKRVPIGTEYPVIVAEIEKLLSALRRVDGLDIRLIVDGTGVGVAVTDMLRAAGLTPVDVTITGGTTVNRTGGLSVTVPKRDLVFSAVAMLESRRLRWPPAEPTISALENELRSFQMKYSKAGNELFEAERREHDDLVLALSMATWLATQAPRMGGPRPVARSYRG